MPYKVLIIKGDSAGCFPVPAVRGGAVQTLIEQIISENEKNKKISIEMISYYDTQAKEIAIQKYPSTEFHWIKPNSFIKFLDGIVYKVLAFVFGYGKAKSVCSLFSALYFIFQSSKILKKEKYDAVILENYIPLGWIIRLSHYAGKYYFHLHNFPRTTGKCLSVLKKCNGFICVSDYIANQLSGGTTPIGIVPKEKIFSLLNGVDMSLFRQLDDIAISEKRKEYGLEKETKVLLFAGRICREKGIDVVINAVKKIDFEKIKLLIVGGTNFTIDVKDEFSKYLCKIVEPIKENVIFTGYIDHNDMPVIYNIADVVILPSVDVEACNLAVGEAISCGKIVITTNMGGISEMADNNALILEISTELENDLAKCLTEILSGDSLIANREKYLSYRNKHSVENYYKRFVEIINKTQEV